MTGKHFVTIAVILSNLSDGVEKDRAIDQFIAFLSTQNPQFDADRFRQACNAV